MPRQGWAAKGQKYTTKYIVLLVLGQRLFKGDFRTMTENFYHRYLNLPFDYPKPELFNDLSKDDRWVQKLDSDIIDDRFKTWIESLGLTISNVIEGFYTKPGGASIPLHTDTSTIPGTVDLHPNDCCKLNFTWGPDDSTTRWYKIKDESKYIKLNIADHKANKQFAPDFVPDIDIKYALLAEWEDVELVHEAVINRPSLLNIGQLHSTWNPSVDKPRWTLCFTLLDNGSILTFNNSLKIFKNYIDN